MKFDSWHVLREKRNRLLAETDKYMLSDFPVDTRTRGLYRDYRQYLRNLPKMFDNITVKTAKVKTFEEYIEFRKNGVY